MLAGSSYGVGLGGSQLSVSELSDKLWSFPFKLCDHFFLGAASAYNASTVLGSNPSASAFAYNDVLCTFDYPLGSFVAEAVASPECVCFFSKFDHVDLRCYGPNYTDTVSMCNYVYIQKYK